MTKRNKFYSDKKILENRNVLKVVFNNSNKIDDLKNDINDFEGRIRKKIDISNNLILGSLENNNEISKENLDEILKKVSVLKSDMDVLFNLLSGEVLNLRNSVCKLLIALIVCVILTLCSVFWR